MRACHFETTVQVGCDDCSLRRVRKVSRAAVNVLAGLDTSGVPLKVTERLEVPLDGLSIDPGGMPVQLLGTIPVENNYRGQPVECSPAGCMHEEHIATVVKGLDDRIVGLSRGQGEG